MVQRLHSGFHVHHAAWVQEADPSLALRVAHVAPGILWNWPRSEGVHLIMTPAWTPKNPDYETVLRQSFERQGMMATLGARLVHLAPGEVDLSAPYAPEFGQENGYWHAGAVASLADSANGYAALSLAPPDTNVLAVEFKINLLAPARGAVFLAQGRVVRPGRTLTVCLAEVFSIEGPLRAPIATMLSTVIVRQVRDGG
jgi:uncharacterized protein (TIGR00369 family)